MKRNVSMPVMVTIAVVVALVLCVTLFKTVTGGTQGDGQRRIEASPPIPNSVKQEMMQGGAKNGG